MGLGADQPESSRGPELTPAGWKRRSGGLGNGSLMRQSAVHPAWLQAERVRYVPLNTPFARARAETRSTPPRSRLGARRCASGVASADVGGAAVELPVPREHSPRTRTSRAGRVTCRDCRRRGARRGPAGGRAHTFPADACPSPQPRAGTSPRRPNRFGDQRQYPPMHGSRCRARPAPPAAQRLPRARAPSGTARPWRSRFPRAARSRAPPRRLHRSPVWRRV